MDGEFPWRGKQTSSCHTNGGAPAGGKAAGAGSGVPHGVVVMTVSARSWAGGAGAGTGASPWGACEGAWTAAGEAAVTVVMRIGPHATIASAMTASHGPLACCLPIKPHVLPLIDP